MCTARPPAGGQQARGGWVGPFEPSSFIFRSKAEACQPPHPQSCRRVCHCLGRLLPNITQPAPGQHPPAPSAPPQHAAHCCRHRRLRPQQRRAPAAAPGRAGRSPRQPVRRGDRWRECSAMAPMHPRLVNPRVQLSATWATNGLATSRRTWREEHRVWHAPCAAAGRHSPAPAHPRWPPCPAVQPPGPLGRPWCGRAAPAGGAGRGLWKGVGAGAGWWDGRGAVGWLCSSVACRLE